MSPPLRLLPALGLVAVLAGGALHPAVAQALRCGGRPVSIEDRKVEVLSKCGEPTLRETRLEERSQTVFSDRGRKKIIDRRRVASVVEEWTYNFGPHRFLHFLTFRNGGLVAIETGGYGFVERDAVVPGLQCRGENFALRRGKLEMMRHCGEPTSVDVREVERTRTTVDGDTGRAVERGTTVTVEEWTYNFGPHRLLTVFTFENGRVADVRTLGYGY